LKPIKPDADDFAAEDSSPPAKLGPPLHNPPLSPMTRHPALARPAIQSLRGSRIREVAQSVADSSDVLAFWFGEPDAVTPDFVREAAKKALDDGDTFYTSNFGIPPLREALAKYTSGLHGAISPERIAVTSSGVSALMLANQLLISPGDRVVVVTPVWPNLVEIPRILGAQVVEAALTFNHSAGDAAQWTLDTEQLLALLTPQTRLLVVNSPNNPSGWVMPADQQQQVLAHCRRHGIWILSDDVYERLYYADPEQSCASAFLDIADEHDRLISVNSFSKNWLMTGWRLGWITAPQSVMADLGKLLEYNTSCAPGFVQRAGLAALASGDAVIRDTVERFRASRDRLFAGLQTIPGVTANLPPGGMYLFFHVDGLNDSLALCKQLVIQSRLGLAPGSAFGEAGEGYLRWCFASTPQRLDEGVRRLGDFLTHNA
jgi:aspartate/methionine/tyrosine aminotransferase